MRVMVMVKATKNSEAGVMPSESCWVRHCPDPMPGEESEIEIRPVFEADDFGKAFTPELRPQEERLRTQVERQRKS